MTTSGESEPCPKCLVQDPRPGGKLCAGCAVCRVCQGTSGKFLLVSDEVVCVKCSEEKRIQHLRGNAEERILRAGIPPRYEFAEEASLDPRQSAVLKDYLAFPFGNLAITGNAGVGKTWTAVVVLKKLMRQGNTGKYYSLPWIFAELRDRISDKSFRITEFVREVIGYDYLILDDLGANRATDWAVETLYLILDQWDANQKKGLIITTNLDMKSISKSYSDRITSRLSASCRTAHIDGADRRIDRENWASGGA